MSWDDPASDPAQDIRDVAKAQFDAWPFVTVIAAARPCYICSRPVRTDEGWWREDRAWCHAHRPVWSHE